MKTQTKRGRRGKFEIYGDILEAIDTETLRWGNAQLTRTQLITNMSYDRFKEDLLKLQERGLVSTSEQDGGLSSVSLTTAGREYLERYRGVKAFLENYRL